jgi:glycine/serine hydroxymethyltransferase
MENVAGYIIEALDARDNEDKLANIGVEVAKFASHFPVPGLDL